MKTYIQYIKETYKLDATVKFIDQIMKYKYEEAINTLNNENPDIDKIIDDEDSILSHLIYIYTTEHDGDDFNKKLKKLIYLLIDKGSDVNGMDNNGNPLWYSTFNNHLDITKKLIENGANPNWVDKENKYTYLHNVFNIGNYDIAKYLIENGAEMHQDRIGNYPFNHKNAFELGADQGEDNLEIQELLIQKFPELVGKMEKEFKFYPELKAKYNDIFDSIELGLF